MTFRRRASLLERTLLALAVASGVGFSLFFAGLAPRGTHAAPASATSPEEVRQVLTQYCVLCHNESMNTGGLAFETLDLNRVGADPERWEHVVRRLRTGTMPPGGVPRPDEATYDAVASWLEGELDRAWAESPNPGRINAAHRLNRTEYNNAIRDLLDLEIDVRALLPGDETADGSFDNFADVLTLSTAHLERYMSVARQVTRLAIGLPPSSPVGEIFEIPLHLTQNDQPSVDLPLGSRGGIAVPYHFPSAGEYLIRVRLRRQYQDYLMGMGWPQQMDLRLNGRLLERFTVGGGALQYRPSAASYAGSGEPGSFGDPEWEEYMQVSGDLGLEVRVQVPAGPAMVGVAFVREQWEPENLPQPIQRGRVLTNDQLYMDNAAVHSVEIAGPFLPADLQGDTPARRRIFVCEPEQAEEEVACAREILSTMARRAYRRPVSEGDVNALMEFYDIGRVDGGTFEAGVQFALERLLVDPEFLLRLYREPAQTPDPIAVRLTDIELASRLSFFLWSSIPDDSLLDLAEAGRLSDPIELEAQVRRMLSDPRALESLVDNFAAQWLNMRLLSEQVADPDLYPDFDDNLLEAFYQETSLFIGSTITEDRNVLDLLRADYTYVNERLARHYGIPGIYGNRFRRVTLPNPEQRGGILAHGGLMTVTSYPDRTSPVLRGKWLLDNILGAESAPPPANVDTSLDQGQSVAGLPIRERLEQHRQDPVCASCHSIMDPLGFALENFDAVGAWRDVDASGNPIDNIGTWPSGVELNGVASLRALLLEYDEQFVGALTRKLMAYGLGRRLEYFDQPTVRSIVREAASDDYRWSSILLGIVKSPAFMMRRTGIAD